MINAFSNETSGWAGQLAMKTTKFFGFVCTNHRGPTANSWLFFCKKKPSFALISIWILQANSHTYTYGKYQIFSLRPRTRSHCVTSRSQCHSMRTERNQSPDYSSSLFTRNRKPTDANLIEPFHRRSSHIFPFTFA